jgi:VCBS repeat-containing protein
VDPPNHGTLTLDTAGNFTYTPAANFNGLDSFIYQLCDVDNDCDTALVVITVTPVDDFPIAVNDRDTTNEDTPLSGSVRGNDTLSGDGGNLISVVDPPNHGILTLDTAGNFTYTPDANFNGTDTLTYALCDVDGDCDTATLVITVTPVDDFPVAVNDADTTNEDTPLSGSVRGNDTLSGDGGNLISVVDPPNHGTLTLDTAGNYTYTPAANFNGLDSFIYQLCDVDNDCDTALVVITVTPVDDFPIAVNDRDTTNEDTPLSGSVRGNDTLSGDGGNLISVVDPPNHGILTLDTAGNFTYTPDANFNGTDTLTYALCDVDGDCDTATLVITVTPVDDFPVAVNDTDTTNEDTPVTGSVRGNDTLSGDGGNLISVVDPPNHGTLTLDTAGNYTYTPAANFNGLDSFIYQLCDVDNDCDTALV